MVLLIFNRFSMVFYGFRWFLMVVCFSMVVNGFGMVFHGFCIVFNGFCVVFVWFLSGFCMDFV